MRWDFGKVYQKIRQSKGLSQQEVCGEFLSRVALSKIENCKAIPNFEHMLFLLDQVDMTVDEFQYICNFYQPSERQKIISSVRNILSSSDFVALEDLLESCEAYLQTHSDVPIENIKNTVAIFLWVRKHGIQQNNPDYQELVHRIWDSLKKRDVWYVSDLRLFNAILHYFSVEQLKELSPYIFQTLSRYKGYRNIQNDQRVLLTNLSTLYLKNGCYDDCEEVTEQLLELCQDIKRYDGLALAQIRLGICRKEQGLIAKGCQLLEVCEESRLLALANQEIVEHLQ
ncbi:helix-turn-helix domain-containing protein [Streptococcus plurextorum]|uniref:helix-turn-helix domain-containing protein n=1 Tax=Streptococcus plurextorum TaxID=456876 RepID=UPI000416103E|nr:Rgg/GadR/MutR family transcriptional regulator [Streptococcus plurextorum]